MIFPLLSATVCARLLPYKPANRGEWNSITERIVTTHEQFQADFPEDETKLVEDLSLRHLSRRSLLAMTVNEHTFPNALRLVAKVVNGAASCPVPSFSQGGVLCKAGKISLDGRTCCAKESSSSIASCQHRKICRTESDVMCKMPIEKRSDEIDVVFFDYSKGFTQGVSHGVDFSELLKHYVQRSDADNIDIPDEVHISHVHDPNLVKLEFAVKYLDPAAANGFTDYEYTMMWDGDGVVSTKTWDTCTYLRLLRASKAGLAQPAYERGSRGARSWMLDPAVWQSGLYRYRRHVHMNFWTWRQDWWATMHGVLEVYPFKYRYADMLPMKCLINDRTLSRMPHPPVAMTGVVVIDATPIKHPRTERRIGKRMLRGGAHVEERRDVDSKYVHNYERFWFEKIHHRQECEKLYTPEQHLGDIRGMRHGGGIDLDGNWEPEVSRIVEY
jgi:hypothetical protein